MEGKGLSWLPPNLKSAVDVSDPPNSYGCSETSVATERLLRPLIKDRVLLFSITHQLQGS